MCLGVTPEIHALVDAMIDAGVDRLDLEAKESGFSWHKTDPQTGAPDSQHTSCPAPRRPARRPAALGERHRHPLGPNQRRDIQSMTRPRQVVGVKRGCKLVILASRNRTEKHNANTGVCCPPRTDVVY